MIYVPLGGTGAVVSALCLGTVTFGRETPEEESREIVSAFLDAGGNFIDTADMYGGEFGAAERILGSALRGTRDSVILATKAYFPRDADRVNDIGLSRVHLTRALHDSLRRLGTDYVDLYYMHFWDGLTPLEETLSTLNAFVAQGKVRYIGASHFSAWQIMKAVGVSRMNGWEAVSAAQLQYSLACRGAEREHIPLCREEHLSFCAWAPLAGGFLTGKYARGRRPAAGRLAEVTDTDTDSWARRAVPANFTVLETVAEVAAGREVPPVQVALAWLRKRDTLAVTGVRTVPQLRENLGSLNVDLSAHEMSRLDAAGRLPDESPYMDMRRISRRYPF